MLGDAYNWYVPVSSSAEYSHMLFKPKLIKISLIPPPQSNY